MPGLLNVLFKKQKPKSSPDLSLREAFHSQVLFVWLGLGRVKSVVGWVPCSALLESRLHSGDSPGLMTCCLVTNPSQNCSKPRGRAPPSLCYSLRIQSVVRTESTATFRQMETFCGDGLFAFYFVDSPLCSY